MRELDDVIASRIQIPPVAGVRGTVAGPAVRIEWKPIPLDLALAYRVYRRVGADGPATLIATTEQSAFEDRSVASGTGYTFTVTALLADRGGATRLPIEPERVREFLSSTAPVRSRQWATFGLRDAPAGLPSVPRAIYETRPSRSVTIALRGT